jgi:hypothetical protein
MHCLSLVRLPMFFNTQAKSVIDPSGVGTRSAIPSIFPFKAGITNATALAAPVVVGIIDIAAARARRRETSSGSSTLPHLFVPFLETD